MRVYRICNKIRILYRTLNYFVNREIYITFDGNYSKRVLNEQFRFVNKESLKIQYFKTEVINK